MNILNTIISILYSYLTLKFMLSVYNYNLNNNLNDTFQSMLLKLYNTYVYYVDFYYYGYIEWYIEFYDGYNNFFNYVNYILYPDYFSFDKLNENVDENVDENINNTNNTNNNDSSLINEIKYENKYLQEIRKLNKEFIFEDYEEEEKVKKIVEVWNNLQNNKLLKFEELKNKLEIVQTKINEHTNLNDDCDSTCDNNSEYDYCESDTETKQESFKSLLIDYELLQIEYNKLKNYLESSERQEELKNKANKIATEYIINKKLEKLKNCYVMEKTPLGNVLMIYDNTKSTFSYYSDFNIPYRYLETVARKYVKFFNCRPVYVDMDEELRVAEEKWEKERQEELNRQEELKKNEDNKITAEKKKNVFAKFKSYNKDNGVIKTMAIPPKNNIPMTKEQENEKILLKEKANRYTYEGKMANFNFLKKIERKIVDKKYGISFSEFKKMQKIQKN